MHKFVLLFISYIFCNKSIVVIEDTLIYVQEFVYYTTTVFFGLKLTRFPAYFIHYRESILIVKLAVVEG